MFNWNWLGILVWLVLLGYLIFISYHIRKRHLKMIVMQQKHFTWRTLGLDFLEILILLIGLFIQIQNSFFDNPSLTVKSQIEQSIEYKPLVLSSASDRSYYVTSNSVQKKKLYQRYSFFTEGNQYSVTSDWATISDGSVALNTVAQKLPYSKQMLAKYDTKYQKAYVAIYEAKYKNTWQNGLGLHVGRTALRYYLIRVPDSTFVREVKN
ncbi:LVIS_2131 family protein [Lactobacillus mulieris]|uniref:LVIS_2131 family protein n=1 Tax=Lactobacillus mulieris TaxID=2508708 RepID=UPI001433404F|nr:LVIS_2131 family protein [Lactobacillus mulieris]MCF1784169.1 LVIS_2131 family protein [Lactobacillus mulieris]MCW8104992.1 LVIS_2131 family protein [Lactobacillus mulieris]MDK6804031.1 LVIS_2131 family protein [Lactobacillus mulieris]MDK8383169.1 LVIS_2131 family protein [Lactobacillus mulieris]MDT9621368.1 LVIS_2131 family protein [Lactobacillus mulieris]